MYVVLEVSVEFMPLLELGMGVETLYLDRDGMLDVPPDGGVDSSSD